MKFIRIISLLCLGVAIMSCQDKDKLTQVDLGGENNLISIEEANVCPTGSEFSIAFTSKEPWTLEHPSWLTPSKTKGNAGTTVIKFNAKINGTRADRSGTLRFVGSDGRGINSIPVSQPFPYLNIDKDSLGFDWNCGRILKEGVEINTSRSTVKISSNIDWRIEELTTKADVDIKEFTVSADNGNGDEELEIIPVRDNYGKNPYERTLRLYPVMKSPNGNWIEIPSSITNHYTIKLHQKNLRFLLNGDTDDLQYEFSELEDKTGIDFTVDTELPWRVESAPSWIKLSKESGTNVLSINLQTEAANPKREVRSGTIRLTNNAGAIRDIAVSQRAYVFDTNVKSYNLGNNDTSEKSVTLNTTGPWEISDVPEWLEVNPTSGTGIADIRLKAKGQNLNFSDNNVVMKLKSMQNDLFENLSIMQSKFIFTLAPDSRLSSIPTISTSAYEVTVNCSGSWHIEESSTPSWLNASKNSESSLSIAPKAPNENTSDLIGTVVVISDAHEAAGLRVANEVSVKHRKFVFEVSGFDSAESKALGADTKSVSVKCSVPWSVESYPEWITPSVTSGDGSQDVNISFTIGNNTNKVTRSGKIIIKDSIKNSIEELEVKQEAFVFNNSTESMEDIAVMNTQKYTISFDLTAGARWEILSGYPTWVHPSATSGMSSRKVEIDFTPDPNPELSVRTGSLSIRCIDNSEIKEINFSQQKYEFDDREENLKFSELSNSEQNIDVLCSGPWKLSDAPDWINTSNHVEGGGLGTITISVKKNIATVARTHKLTLTSQLNSLTRTINISQDAFKFDSSKESFSFGTLEEKTQEIAVICSGRWAVSGVPDWIVASTTSGTGSESGTPGGFSITSRPNYTESVRTATIKVTSDDNPSLVKEISVTQAKFDFSVDQTSLSFGSEDLTAKSVNVSCPGDWTATADSWINISPTTGKDNGSISIKPMEAATEKRSGTVTITSKLSGLTKTITVSQDK